MRDFRDAKAMAQTLREAVSARQLTLTHSESLELVAKMLGLADWNVLSAAIKAAADEPQASRPPAPVEDNQARDRLANELGLASWDALAATVHGARPSSLWREAKTSRPLVQRLASAFRSTPQALGRAGFSENLQTTLRRAEETAAQRRHRHTTLEHLLLGLVDDPDAAAVMDACEVDVERLSASLTRYIDEDLKSLGEMDELDLADANPWLRPSAPARCNPREIGRA